MLTDTIGAVGVLLLTVLVVRLICFLVLSTLHARGERRALPYQAVYPSVSIIVPCFNEEAVLENCIRSLLMQWYGDYEIIIVDDGSTDATASVAASLASAYPAHVRTVSQANGGKARALNEGLRHARGEIVVTIDADSMFLPDTLARLVGGFTNPEVGAVCGNVKVANRAGALGLHQAAEYVLGLNLDRRAFAQLSCVQVIPGAIGAFRKSALMQVGGYSSDTLVEDMDLTITLARHGYVVRYVSTAVAYTEAPETLHGFLTQRHRWLLGGFQVLAKHRDMLFNPRYGLMGIIGLPYFFFGPLMIIVGSFSYLALFASLVLWGVTDTIMFQIIFWGIIVQAGLLLWAIKLDGEDSRLLRVAFTNVFWYPHLVTYAYVRALVTFMRGERGTWKKLPRLGKNVAIV